MSSTIRIGIIGDYTTRNTSHVATDAALGHAASEIGCKAELVWLPTDKLDSGGAGLESLDGLLCAPGSPYASMSGALSAIRYARENDRVFLGTCGGFQHAIIEFARNVLRRADAEHEETSPGAGTLIIRRMSCSLIGRSDCVRVRRDTMLGSIYRTDEATEQFWCNFGVNSEFVDELVRGGLIVSATDVEGSVRAVEHPRHRFYLGTLFIPQFSSTPARPHPVLVAFLAAAVEQHRVSTGRSGSATRHPHLTAHY